MRLIYKSFLPLILLAVLGFVWSVPITNAGGWADFFATSDPAALYFHLFQLAGLTAFTLIAFQILTGPYMKLWETVYGKNFYKFHAYEGLFASLFALLHPSLLLISLWLSDVSYWEFMQGYPKTIYFGPAALFLLIITVSTAASAVLLNQPRFQGWWHRLHLANYLVFLFVFIHSLLNGSDLLRPDSPLRPLWWIFFVAMLVGFIYRRIIRPRTEGDSGLS